MAIRTNRLQQTLVSTAFLAAVLVHRGAEAAELKVCIDQSNPTAQMDARVAQAAARSQGDTVKLIRFDGSGDEDDGYSSHDFRKLATDRCELIMGFPVDAQEVSLPEGLQATPPYAKTGFVLVTRNPAYASLDAMPKGSEVAVTYLTAPNLYFVGHPNVSAQVFTSDAESLHALEHRKVAAAMLWRPYVAGHLHEAGANQLDLTPLSEPHAAWNLVALYTAQGAAAAGQFDAGVATLRRSGELNKLVRPYADAAANQGSVRPARLGRAEIGAGHLLKVADERPAKFVSTASKNPPALYTDAQAAAGAKVFDENCSVCHGPHLEGRAGPALKGPTFATAEAAFSVSDIFWIVSQNMPASAPGTLSKDQYVQVMAFLLQQNGYPAGKKALSYDGAEKSKVALLYRDEEAH